MSEIASAPHEQLVARARGRVGLLEPSDRLFACELEDHVALRARDRVVSMAFDLSPGGRPISVQVRRTDGWVDLKGDRFLRTTLGMKSTLVRMAPF